MLGDRLRTRCRTGLLEDQRKIALDAPAPHPLASRRPAHLCHMNRYAADSGRRRMASPPHLALPRMLQLPLAPATNGRTAPGDRPGGHPVQLAAATSRRHTGWPDGPQRPLHTQSRCAAFRPLPRQSASRQSAVGTSRQLIWRIACTSVGINGTELIALLSMPASSRTDPFTLRYDNSTTNPPLV